jgi:hypothetical protein
MTSKRRPQSSPTSEQLKKLRNSRLGKLLLADAQARVVEINRHSIDQAARMQQLQEKIEELTGRSNETLVRSVEAGEKLKQQCDALVAQNKDLQKRLDYEQRRAAQALTCADNASLAAGFMARLTHAMQQTRAQAGLGEQKPHEDRQPHEPRNG